jgi:dynein regulatory complex protein 1|tara:strand:- start:35 stop:2032 length:1998 start_codon:yes stop_codon:yes gene_type:complete
MEAFGSNTREDRIRSRRERIQKRKDAKASDGQPRALDADGIAEGVSEGKRQTQTSLAHIDRVKATSIEEVTTIRINADNRENRRRISEEDKRQDRLRRLQEEAIESGKRNAAVEMRWQELMGYNMPQELLRELNMQRAGCEAIISSKDSLISEFRLELKGKDEEYVKSLKQQGEDITQLISRMRKQYQDLQTEYASELGQIEEAFMRERDELLSANKTEIDSLFDRRRQMEIQFMELKQEREEGYAEEIASLRVKDAEDYSKLKIKLETDIQTLEQQLEEMRATYQLNTEKLEYNYRVLTERDMENSTTLAQQKRKESRLKDALANYIQKYNTQDSKHKQVNQELTDEYRRITKQYKDLQNKFRHFEVADNDRYQQVWDMHAEECSVLVEKMLQADEIIHSQILGWRWEPPTEDVLAKPSKKEMSETKTEEQLALEGTVQEKGPVSKKKLKVMLGMLCNEAEFLVDQSTRDQSSDTNSQVLEADSILKALSIENEKDVERLLGYFFDTTTDEDEDSDGEDQSQKDPLGALRKTCKVKDGQVVATVRKFVADRAEKQSDDGAMQVQAASMAEKAAAAQRTKRRKEERKFWQRVANVVPPKTVRVWNALSKAMEKYENVVKERSAAIEEVQSLENQNAELKKLMNQYLSADVNDELHVPPTQVIRLN